MDEMPEGSETQPAFREPVAPIAEAEQPAMGAAQNLRPRPLYIPRAVEQYLAAAGLPLPTDQATLQAYTALVDAVQRAQQGGGAAATSTTPASAAAVPAAPTRIEESGSQPNQGNGGDLRRSGHGRGERGHRNERGHRGDRSQRGERGWQSERATDPQTTTSEEAAPGESVPAIPAVEVPVEVVFCEGICEVSGKGFGFLRDAKRGFNPHPSDVFVIPEAVKRYNLRDGQKLTLEARRGGRGLQVHKILSINGCDPEESRTWPAFEDLTTINPMERLTLETASDRATTRLIDMMTPIGKGQRGLIVAPPRTGKTTLLEHIAQAMVINHPEVHLFILLVDERPEEVTGLRRAVPDAEIWASSNDMDVKSHTRISQLCIERAKRLVESGKDVFILLDSITRLGRAFNNAMTGSSKTMSGGIDARALEIPRRIFAAARNTEEAGSLTIVATALIETGSRMDEVIFQEFKGTGNMELVLDRKISEQRIYPAIDIFQSGTRREELLIPQDQLHKINIIRRGLSGHKPVEAVERLLHFVKKFPSNAQLLKEIPG
jgi:transcription termination factor Rho